MLPINKGFKAQKFDDLPNHYENDGTECRGYLLDNVAVETNSDESVSEFSEDKLEGTLIYLANPVRQFSDFTNKATNLDEVSGLYMSEEFLSKSDFNEGDRVRVKNKNGEIIVTVVSDNKIIGDVALLPTFDSKINSEALFSGYRFNTASIEKV
jgi:NADH-quinone oxidoreductase subunit G